jgi:CubicO group peptidase (beta-lactamase class C family)
MKKTISLTLIIVFLTASCSEQEINLPTAKPEKVGMSSERLDRIKPVMQSYVDQNKLPGIITMVARRGKIVHFEKFGNMYPDSPMSLDAIFAIQSMTKPITSVAIMMLYEEGHFQLYDPVAKYIPEFKDLKVFSHKDKDGIHVVDQIKPMTILDLLIHTSGLGYGWGNTPVDSMYNSAKLRDGSLKDMVQKLAKIPLYYQPGTKWNYSISTDVLGYLVEVISGKPFDLFLQERIFVPLKMKDTDFYVPKEKINRVPYLYGPKDSTGIKVITIPDTSRTSKPKKYLNGGGGLFSTAKDYMIFCQMLLNKGEFNGVRILGRKTVEYMTENHISNDQVPTEGFYNGAGWGLGFAVSQDVVKAQIIGSNGAYWWGGAYSTFFQIDPKEQLILILMTHFSPSNYYPTNVEFVVSTYQAIVD